MFILYWISVSYIQWNLYKTDMFEGGQLFRYLKARQSNKCFSILGNFIVHRVEMQSNVYIVKVGRTEISR